MKFLGEHVHLAGKVDLHDAFFAGIEDVVEALALIGQSAVNTRHRRLALGVDEDFQDLVDEVVAGAARDQPIGKGFVTSENLFDDNIDRPL